MKIIDYFHLYIIRVVDDELVNLKPSAFRISLENHSRLILVI